eukprot:1578544-Prymnesium_polylepis.1
MCAGASPRLPSPCAPTTRPFLTRAHPARHARAPPFHWLRARASAPAIREGCHPSSDCSATPAASA